MDKVGNPVRPSSLHKPHKVTRNTLCRSPDGPPQDTDLPPSTPLLESGRVETSNEPSCGTVETSSGETVE